MKHVCFLLFSRSTGAAVHTEPLQQVASPAAAHNDNLKTKVVKSYISSAPTTQPLKVKQINKNQQTFFGQVGPFY